MLDIFKNAWKIEDLRKKLIFTFMIIIVYRIGVAMPVPFLDPAVVAAMIDSSGSMFGYFDLLTGGAFSQATMFALSVTPAINASIIINLLQVAIPYLERLGKEGEEGRRKLQKITRYTTLGISIFLAFAYYLLLRSKGAVLYTEGFNGYLVAAVIITCFVAGAMLIMWLGEQIDAKGIGNGLSLLIFAGIVSSFPSMFNTLKGVWDLGSQGQPFNYFLVPIIIILALAAVVFIVIMNNGERRIPVQYAKRVVGRKMYGGQSTHIPIKVSLSGVMPVIFASALISIPGTLKNLFGWDNWFINTFDLSGWGYVVVYTALIVMFNFFYVTIQYNPIEMANQLRQNNGSIPGIRPGKPTQEYISRVLSKITVIGAVFLAVIAISPMIISMFTGVNLQLGGTSLIIVVGVAIDTARQLESYMLMRHHKGFLE